MTAKRYLIKFTCGEGAHIGESYLIGVGNRVVDDGEKIWSDMTYSTEKFAKKVCAMKNEKQPGFCKGEYVPFPVDVEIWDG